MEIRELLDLAVQSRFQDGVSQGAKAAADSLEALAAANEKVQAEQQQTTETFRRAGPSLETVNRRLDENARLTAATERANRQYAATLETIRRERQAGTISLERELELERRASVARDQAIDKARQQAAAMRAIYETGPSGTGGMEGMALAAQRATAELGPLQRALSAVGAEVAGMSGRLGVAGAGLSALGATAAVVVGALAGVGTALAAIAVAGDQMTATLGRITAASDSLAGATAAFEGLYRIAFQTGTSMADAAPAYARFAVAVKEVGATSGDALRLVETLQKAAILAGSTASEAQATAMQLGQALASGRLSGDELRSFLENAGPLAALFARELGVGVGELRKMGEEGKLTADVVLPAMLRAGERINEQFDKLPPTMSRAFGQLGTAMSRFVADLDQALGLSRSIAEAAARAATSVDSYRRRWGLGTSSERAENRSDQAGRSQAATGDQLAMLDRTISGLEAQAPRAGSPDDEILKGLRRQRELLRQEYTARSQEAQNADLEFYMEANERAIQQDAERNRAAAKQRENEVRRVRERNEEARKGLNEREEIEKKYNERVEAFAAMRTAAEQEAAAAREEIARRRSVGADASDAEKRLAAALADVKRAAADSNAALEERNEKLEKLANRANRAATENRNLNRDLREEPTINPETGLLSFSPAEDRVQTMLRRRADRDRQPAERAAAEAQREAERIARENERITDDVTRYIGDRFADVFSATSQGWRGLLESMRSTAIRLFARLSAEAIFRPIVAPIVSGLFGGGGGVGGAAVASGGGGTGLLGGITQSLGLNMLGSQLSNFGQTLGLTGSGGLLTNVGAGLGLTGAGGLLGTTVIGMSPAQYAAASVADGGFGAATAAPGTTLGQMLGGVGLGFAAGSLVGGLIAQSRGTVGPGSTIGAGGGALAGAIIGSIIPGIGTLIGGMIGGLIGGSGGAFIGPTQKGMAQRSGGNVIWDVVNGELAVVHARGKRWDEAGAVSSVQEQLTAINKAAAERGLTFDLGGLQDRDRNIGFGQGAERAGWNMELNQAAVVRSLRSTNANVTTALATLSANGADLDTALKGVDFVQKAYNVLLDSAKPANEFKRQMDALLKSFEEAAVRTRELGLSETALAEVRDANIAKLNEARDFTMAQSGANLAVRVARAQGRNRDADVMEFDRAAAAERRSFRENLQNLDISGQAFVDRMAELEATLAEERLAVLRRYGEAALTETQKAEQRRAASATAANMVTSLSAYALSLRNSVDAPISARARYEMTRSDFNAVLGAAQAGDSDSIQKLQSYADPFLAASREVNGSGVEWANDVARVLEGIRSIVTMPEDRLTAAVLAQETRQQTQVLQEEQQKATSLLEAILAELQQQNRAPLRMVA